MRDIPGTVEMQFAEIIWKNEPVPSGKLVQIAAEELGWKKSTTYTMLRRLCARGIFENVDTVVRAKLSRAEFDAMQSENFVKKEFGGSLPKFIAAFTSRQKLSEAEIDELQKLIDESRKG